MLSPPTSAAALLLSACLAHTALGFAPASPLPSLRGARGLRAGASSLRANMAEDEAMAERMADIVSHEMDAVAGLEGGPPKQEKFLGSSRLNKLKNKVMGQDESTTEHNLAVGFDHLLNELKGLKGTEGFRGSDADSVVDGVNAVASEIKEGDDTEALAQEEAKLLGSRRLYKLVKKGTVTASRERNRRNHPGESIQQNFHGR